MEDIVIDVGIVVVNYKSDVETGRFLRRLAATPMPDACTRGVVVVDNGGTLKRSSVEREREPCVLVQPQTNRGYLNGANVGITAFEERWEARPEWWIVANPDLRLSAPFFQRLLKSSWPDSVALLGPDVREERAWPRNPFHVQRPPARWVRSRVALFSSTQLAEAYVRAARVKRRVMDPPSVPAEPTRIYAPHGSLMVFHRRFFERGGTLEYEGVLYGEEIHVAEQIRQLGMDVLWAPSLTARHQGRRAVADIPAARRYRWWRESYAFLYQTYFR